MSVRSVALPVSGMSCASCAATIEGALRGLEGVEWVQVNLAAGKVLVTYDPGRVDLQRIAATIADVGYSVARDEVTLEISGMSCASCVAHVEGALMELEGVLKATVNLGLGIARVEYIPDLVPPARMVQAVEVVGYAARVRSEAAGALDREQETRREEIRRQGLNLLFAAPIALLVMLGTFRDYWILPSIVPEWLGYNRSGWDTSGC
jgi:Cu+-exporting ATPase